MEQEISRVKVKFGNLDFEVEGAQSFVKECLGFIEEKVLPLLSTMPQIPAELAKEQPKIVGAVQEPTPPIKEVPLFNFYKEKKPSGHDETVMVFAYYLKRYEGLNEFSPTDIERCYDEVGVRKPSRVRQTIINIKNNKGWLTPSKRGFYRLTNIGENLVVQDLPRDSGSEKKKQ